MPKTRRTSSLKYMALGFVLMLGVIAGVNYLADPAHVLKPGRYELRLAKALAGGMNAVNVTNFDERVLQKYYLEAAGGAASAVVIGSSRAMEVGTRHLSHQGSFFNHSVSATSIEDIAAIWQLVEEAGPLPKVVVLGLDPWLLNAFNQTPSWRSIRSAYFRYLKENSILPTDSRYQRVADSSRIQTLFSSDYFITSVKELIHGGGRLRRFAIRSDDRTDAPVRRADGTGKPAASTRAVNEHEVAMQAAYYVPGHQVTGLGKFKTIDPFADMLLENLVKHIKSRVGRVIFYLGPYHPIAYDDLIAHPLYRVIRTVEDRLRALAKSQNITVLGSYDPRRARCPAREFTDPMHFRIACLERIFKSE